MEKELLERTKVMDEEAKKSQWEQELLKKQNEMDHEKAQMLEKLRADLEVEKQNVRDEMKVEIYAQLDEERFQMEEEIRQFIGHQLGLQSESLDELLKPHTFSHEESQLVALRQKLQLEFIRTQLWVDGQKTELSNQRKDLDNSVTSMKKQIQSDAEKLSLRESKL